MQDVVIPKARFFKTDLENSNRNFGLDLARTVCILSIVLLHSNNFLGAYISYKFLGQPGFILQDLVFALSGFLIGKQLISLNKDSNYFGSLLKFYRNRWLRTIPFYFIFLILNLCLFYFIYRHSDQVFFKDEFQAYKYFLFLQNFNGSHPYFYPEMWPLPIEEWSYLLIPIVLLLCRIIFKRINFLSIVIALMIGTSIFRTTYLYGFNFDFDWDVRKVVLLRMDALLYGFAIRLLMDKYPDWFKKTRNFLLIGSLLLCAIAFASRGFRNEWWYASTYFITMPACMAITIPYFYFSGFDWLSNGLKKLITHLSLVSYAILLSHLYCVQFIMLQAYQPKNLLEGLVFAIIYLIILLFFGTIFFNFIEWPILKYRKASGN